MLEIKEFSKKYKGSEIYAASNVSFKVPDGKVLGLVGHNGAGKSTTIKSLVGILPFSEGEMILDGFDIKKDPIKAKQIIGYVPDDHSVYEKLTGREYVNYMGSIFGVSKELKKERIEKYAKLFDIEFALDNQISSYSHGMKQKICLIGSLIHQPKLWILDEPMMGLDPQIMDEVKNCIRNYAKEGNIVIFSSHSLEVVEEICDIVGIMKKGKLVAYFSMAKAKEKEGFTLKRYYNQLNKKTTNE